MQTTHLNYKLFYVHIINYWSFYQPVLGSLYNTLTTGSGAEGGAGGGGGPRPSMGI